MPLTPLQKEVLTLLAKLRTPESHAAGGAVINRDAKAPRFSSDLDFFHDSEDLVRIYAERDAEVLRAAGYGIEWLLRNAYLHQATIRKGTDALGLDWRHDSAFRFFPVLADPEFGFCLHPLDVATNKMMALAGRSKIRDYLDILYLDRGTLSLAALCWAACGKDPGFNPLSLLEMAKRHVHYRQEELETERLNKPISLQELKQQWLRAAEEAAALFDRLPAEEMGCLYLDATGKAVTPDPDSPAFLRLIRHFGSVRGAWPQIMDHR